MHLTYLYMHYNWWLWMNTRSNILLYMVHPLSQSISILIEKESVTQKGEGSKGGFPNKPNHFTYYLSFQAKGDMSSNGPFLSLLLIEILSFPWFCDICNCCTLLALSSLLYPTKEKRGSLHWNPMQLVKERVKDLCCLFVYTYRILIDTIFLLPL